MTGTPLSLGPLHALDFPPADGTPVATVVLAHGLGLGPWIFEPWIPTFQAWGLRVVALTMPGHAPGAPDDSVTLARCVDDVAAAIRALSGPVVLLGHSFSALVAQLVAARPDMKDLRGVALVCPAPPGQVRIVPDRTQVRHATGVLPALLGRGVRPGFSSYRQLGMSHMDEAAAQEAWSRTVPWPAGIVRGLARRPEVDPTAIPMPVVVAIGFHDRVVPWQKARLLGDLYEAVVWRYDDLGHMPMLEAGGIRMGRDLARWCAEPVRPQVIESEGYGPNEGVGHLLRRARRGELMKMRSAYGQKKAAR